MERKRICDEEAVDVLCRTKMLGDGVRDVESCPRTWRVGGSRETREDTEGLGFIALAPDTEPERPLGPIDVDSLGRRALDISFEASI